MNPKETSGTLLPSPPASSGTAESRLVIVLGTQTIDETRGSESQEADNRRGMSSSRGRDSRVRFEGIGASRRRVKSRVANSCDYVLRPAPLTA